jgi:hypothetical protein
MKTEENLGSELGAVAFLDVLGMRGIWQQDTNVLKKLHAAKDTYGAKIIYKQDSKKELNYYGKKN